MSNEQFMEHVTEWAQEQVRADQECLEKACEASLQTGRWGVLVLTSPTTHRMLSAEVSDEVPYGAIYYREAQDVPR